MENKNIDNFDQLNNNNSSTEETDAKIISINHYENIRNEKLTAMILKSSKSF